MPFTVRVAKLADVSQIVDLHVSAWRETYFHLLPEGFFTDEHTEGRRRMWNHIFRNPREDWNVRVAESGGKIIGFAFVGPSFGPEGQELPRDRQVFSIYVAAAHHGTGAGQALFDAAAGDGPVMLWVAKENPRAVAFYRRNGFAFDGVEQSDPGAPKILDAHMVR